MHANNMVTSLRWVGKKIISPNDEAIDSRSLEKGVLNCRFLLLFLFIDSKVSSSRTHVNLVVISFLLIPR